MAILEVSHITKTFGARQVLKDISFAVERGEVIVIMGGSGCGKSTLLKIIVGLLLPDSGDVLINGENLCGLSYRQKTQVRKMFGMLFQGAALFNSMTIRENLRLAMEEHTHLDDDVMDIVVKMKLEMVGLSGFEDLKPAEISGGMKKRVGLARAIALDPELVFCDEPGAGLDPVTAGMIDRLIVDLSKKLGITFVVVTHEMGSAFRIADRIIMMNEGVIQAMGTPEEIRASDSPAVQQFLKGGFDTGGSLKVDDGEYWDRLLSNES